jgi:hypothetical protein
MVLEKIRHFVFSVAAVALLLVTVLPNVGVNAGMPDMDSSEMSVSNGMMCPDCPTNVMKAGSVSCTQGSCIGLAVIAESGPLFGSNHQTFFQATIVRPDEIALTPPTPPI